MMKKRSIFLILLTSLLLFTSCRADDTGAVGTTEGETTTVGTTKKEELSPAITTEDLAPAVITTEAEIVSEPLSVKTANGMTFEQFKAENPDFNEYLLKMIFTLLSGDGAEFSRVCGLPDEVYGSLDEMEFGGYKLYYENIPPENDPSFDRDFPVLELEVTKSDGGFLPEGRQKLIFDEGMYLTFHVQSSGEFKWYSDYMGETRTPAEIYVDMVGSDCDFETILVEGKRQWGIGEFIVLRLTEMTGDIIGEYTADEINAYAEKYLGIDGGTLPLKNWLYENDGKYSILGHGGASFVRDFIGTEIRGDGTTVVTVQFWADHSRTVPSRKVEFHMTELDGEFVPKTTVILEDSGLRTAIFGC